MIKSYYTQWSDEIFRTADLTLEFGTADDTYDVDRLVDDNPAHLFKATGTTVVLKAAFPVKQPLALLALVHTTLEATDDVWIQADDDDDWYDPAFELQITPSGWVGSGVTRWPVNTWVDLLAAGLDPLGYKAYRLTFGVASPLAQALQMGQLWGSPELRTFYLDRGFQETRTKPRIDNRTAFEVSTIYTRGTTVWKAQPNLSTLLDADDERQPLQDQWSDVDGGNRPWFLVPDHNDPRGYLVRWATTEEQIQRVVQGVSDRPGSVEEVGRGLRPGV